MRATSEHDTGREARACVRLTCPLSLTLSALLVARWRVRRAQNTGLALTIALSAMAPSDIGEASGVPLVYGIVEILVIPVFAMTAWRLGWTYAPKDENIFMVLAGNYQPKSEATMV